MLIDYVYKMNFPWLTQIVLPFRTSFALPQSFANLWPGWHAYLYLHTQVVLRSNHKKDILKITKEKHRLHDVSLVRFFSIKTRLPEQQMAN